jgi:hypothetical protein
MSRRQIPSTLVSLQFSCLSAGGRRTKIDVNLHLPFTFPNLTSASQEIKGLVLIGMDCLIFFFLRLGSGLQKAKCGHHSLQKKFPGFLSHYLIN